MQLSVATNFDDQLIERISEYPVAELYGKLSSDAVGGGRASFMLPRIGRRRVERHVEAAHRAGIRFNYLLNAACLNNMEYTRKGQRAIRGLLDWVTDIGADAVTVSVPFLLETLKSDYPHLKVKVGVFAQIDSLRKVKGWEAMGADAIVLDSLTVNREFASLKAIREGARCELVLLVNNNCLESCHLSPYHMQTLSHGSQAGHSTKGFMVDYCYLHCSRAKLSAPVNYIRSDWIRPEDLHHYEAVGYDTFKIVERNAPTDVLVRRVKAYAERSYEGNLLDLIQGYAYPSNGKGGADKRSLAWRASYILRPLTINLARLLPLKRLIEKRSMVTPQSGPPPVFIDNKLLDGFMERFLAEGCRDVDCESCRYCHRVAAEVVEMEPVYRRECLTLHREVHKKLVSGEAWRYLPIRPSGGGGCGDSCSAHR